MGVILLFLFYFTSLWVPKSSAEEYKFCEAKPLGKYCLSDNSGWRECLIDYLDEPAEELHYCPADSKCTCTGKLEDGNCVTHRENPCVRSNNERERPEFPQSYFGVIFVTDAFCDKDGCEGRIVVSEKYRDNKKGDRSREDLVMGLTQHITVIIIPEGSTWSQYVIDLKEGSPICNKTVLPDFRGLAKVPENFRYNGTVEILGVECEDWVYEASNQGNFSAIKDKAQDIGVSQTVRDKILARLTDEIAMRKEDVGGGQIVEVHHIYVAKINGTNVPLKVEFAIAIPSQKIFTHYKEFMVAYYPNKSISISSESRIFDLPDACTSQGEEGGAIGDVPLDIQTVKRQHHHRGEKKKDDGNDFKETKRFLEPSLKSEMQQFSDLLEHYRVADHMIHAFQTD